MKLPDGNHPLWIDEHTGLSIYSNAEGIQGARDRIVERFPGDRHMGVTLGAIRRGKYVPFVPRDSTLEVWTACARQKSVTGVDFPHAYFIQTLGGDRESGSIHCPGCRTELMLKLKLKPQYTTEIPRVKTTVKKSKINPNQGSLF